MMKFFFMFLMYLLMSLKFKQFKLFNYLIFPITLMLIFKINYINILNSIYLTFGIDSMNLFLIMLTLWTMMLAFNSNFNFLKNMNKNNFHLIMLFMLFFLMMFFFSMNFLYFYIFFECSMIPIMMIIMGWGNQIDRIQALMFMLFYTLFGSLPLMLIIFIIYNNMSTLLMFNILNLIILKLDFNFFIFIFLILGFLIKIPMYFFHLWLPKAHVESPISGSMILASIMLKLGTYGFLRLMTMFKKLFFDYNKIIIPLMIWGMILSCIVTININDLKIINAYSSVIHMNSMMFSMSTNFYWSIFSSKMMMLSHGLCSSSIFCLINFYYERMNSRNILIIKGLINFSPIMSLWWFLMSMSNISAPPSLNFFSEIMLINSMMIYSKLSLIFIIMMIFLSSMIFIYFYSMSQHNNFFINLFNMKNFSKREYIINLNHFIPIILMIMFFNLFI